MIDLVLQADGEQTVGLDLKDLAVEIERTYPDAFAALHCFVDAGHGQTPFLTLACAVPRENFRVDKDTQVGLFLGDVEYQHALVHIYLGRGEPNAWRGVHGLGHVGGELTDTVIDGRNRFGPGVQARIGKVQYRQ